MSALHLLAQAVAVAPQTAREPGGAIAAKIDWLWELMLWSSTVITLAVVVALAIALFRRRRPHEMPPEADRSPDLRGELANDESGGRGREDRGRPRSERIGARWMVGAGIVFPTLVLTALFFVSLVTLGAIYPRRGEQAALTIELTGKQWWWEVRYLSDEPALIVRSANEIHIPVGTRVRVLLRSDDVIHSFWVPGLHGKTDMIPGRTNVTWLQADEPGAYRGQCAEFCGMQHAKMALVVVAQPRAEFDAWLARERQPAAVPVDSATLAAREVFLSSGCVLCHAVRGTPAHAAVGPDLTHVASRMTLAAGELPNNTGNLYGWIANPQSLKPGTRMPAVPLSNEQLHHIVRYVSSLR